MSTKIEALLAEIRMRPELVAASTKKPRPVPGRLERARSAEGSAGAARR